MVRHDVIERVLHALQPGEHGLKNPPTTVSGSGSINLIHIRRLMALQEPFPVGRLLKSNGGQPLMPKTKPGGWAYVWRELAQLQDEEE